MMVRLILYGFNPLSHPNYSWKPTWHILPVRLVYTVQGTHEHRMAKAIAAINALLQLPPLDAF